MTTTAQPSAMPASTDEPVDISVVIPAYHGAATIAACLASVLRATEGRRAEIIVVDSSGDRCGEIVREHFPDVKLVLSPTRLSAGAARNRGVAMAQGRIVFFVDQDCVVPHDWIAALEKHFADPAIGGAGGSLGILNPECLTGCGVYFLEFLRHFPHDGPPQRNRNFLLGCNSAYRADLLHDAAFPDQTLGEDVLLSHQMRQQGFDLVYDPRVEVLHRNREGREQFFRYNAKMGTASAADQLTLNRPRSRLFLRFPILAFLTPAVVLPVIFVRLLRCSKRRTYLPTFLLLLPLCLAGNLVWSAAFRREVLASRRRDACATLS
jgi:glycosyltransferase involved in cell wall biosynthesis